MAQFSSQENKDSAKKAYGLYAGLATSDKGEDGVEANWFGKLFDKGAGINSLGFLESGQGILEKEKAGKLASEADALDYKPYEATTALDEATSMALKNYLAADARSKFGLSDEEKNLAINQQSRQQNFATQNANRTGGNVGAFYSGVNNAMDNDFGLNLASVDQATQRSKTNDALNFFNVYGNMVSQGQGIKNMETERNNYLTLLKQQMAGKAVSDARAREQARANANFQMATAGVSAFGGGSMGGGTLNPTTPSQPTNTYLPPPSGTPFTEQPNFG